MKIELREAAKRYRREWVLRRLSYTFEAGRSYAVSGPNGSGKSTLLRLLSGHLTPSRGQVTFSHAGKAVPPAEVYQLLSFAAPYIDLVEEFTLTEAIRFHGRFKAFQPGLSAAELPALLQLDHARNKPVSHFSSGMKQRLKLGLAICSHTPLLLLDEPTTTLDANGARWYLDLAQRYLADRLVIVASNVPQDFAFCTEQLSVTDFK